MSPMFSIALSLLPFGILEYDNHETNLVGLASLPAATFERAEIGHSSGHFLDDPIDGIRRPRYATQPIGNVSGLAHGTAPGEFLGIADNGYGTKARSADFLLSVYRLRPTFRTEEGGDGSVAVELAFRLSDPGRHIPWPIVADGATYPNSDVPVPAEVREKRILTGGDFSPESIVKADDGTFWIGDDYGPFLLHVDAQGRLLRPPAETQIRTPLGSLHSPDHPTKDPSTGLVRSGGGFAGLTLDKYGRPFAVTGLPLAREKEGHHLQILDIAAQDGGVPWQEWSHHDWILPNAPAGTQVRIGDMIHTPGGNRMFLAAVTGERPGEAISTMYVLRFMFAYGRRNSSPDISRVRGQWPMIDLLDLADPHDLNGDSDRARFRFDACDPAALLQLDDRTLLIASDNDAPPAGGDPGEPTRLIMVRAAEPLVTAAGAR